MLDVALLRLRSRLPRALQLGAPRRSALEAPQEGSAYSRPFIEAGAILRIAAA